MSIVNDITAVLAAQILWKDAHSYRKHQKNLA